MPQQNVFHKLAAQKSGGNIFHKLAARKRNIFDRLAGRPSGPDLSREAVIAGTRPGFETAAAEGTVGTSAPVIERRVELPEVVAEAPRPSDEEVRQFYAEGGADKIAKAVGRPSAEMPIGRESQEGLARREGLQEAAEFFQAPMRGYYEGLKSGTEDVAGGIGRMRQNAPWTPEYVTGMVQSLAGGVRTGFTAATPASGGLRTFALGMPVVERISPEAAEYMAPVTKLTDPQTDATRYAAELADIVVQVIGAEFPKIARSIGGKKPKTLTPKQVQTLRGLLPEKTYATLKAEGRILEPAGGGHQGPFESAPGGVTYPITDPMIMPRSQGFPTIPAEIEAARARMADQPNFPIVDTRRLLPPATYDVLPDGTVIPLEPRNVYDFPKTDIEAAKKNIKGKPKQTVTRRVIPGVQEPFFGPRESTGERAQVVEGKPAPEATPSVILDERGKPIPVERVRQAQGILREAEKRLFPLADEPLTREVPKGEKSVEPPKMATPEITGEGGGFVGSRLRAKPEDVKLTAEYDSPSQVPGMNLDDIVAIKTKDGKIHTLDEAQTHAEVFNDLKLKDADVESAGWMNKKGEYVPESVVFEHLRKLKEQEKPKPAEAPKAEAPPIPKELEGKVVSQKANRGKSGEITSHEFIVEEPGTPHDKGNITVLPGETVQAKYDALVERFKPKPVEKPVAQEPVFRGVAGEARNLKVGERVKLSEGGREYTVAEVGKSQITLKDRSGAITKILPSQRIISAAEQGVLLSEQAKTPIRARIRPSKGTEGLPIFEKPSRVVQEEIPMSEERMWFGRRKYAMAEQNPEIFPILGELGKGAIQPEYVVDRVTGKVKMREEYRSFDEYFLDKKKPTLDEVQRRGKRTGHGGIDEIARQFGFEDGESFRSALEKEIALHDRLRDNPQELAESGIRFPSKRKFKFTPDNLEDVPFVIAAIAAGAAATQDGELGDIAKAIIPIAILSKLPGDRQSKIRAKEADIIARLRSGKLKPEEAHAQIQGLIKEAQEYKPETDVAKKAETEKPKQYFDASGKEIQVFPHGKPNPRGILLPEEFAKEAASLKDLNIAEARMLTPTDWLRATEKIDGKVNGPVRKFVTKPIEAANLSRAEEVRSTVDELRNLLKETGIRHKRFSFDPRHGLEAPTKESRRIFQSLEGKLDGELTANEKKVETYLRGKYDNFLDRLNAEREKINLPPIPKRKNYVTHFEELTLVGEMFGSLADPRIPPDMLRAMDASKPNTPFFPYALQRKGGAFTEDAIGAFERYMHRALNSIHMSVPVADARAYVKHFPGNAAHYFDNWLSEGVLGKQTGLDRSIPMWIKKPLNTVAVRVGKNLILGNARVFITQLSSAAQTFAEAGMVNGLKGAISALTPEGFWMAEKYSKILKLRELEGLEDIHPSRFRVLEKLSAAHIEAADRFMVRMAWNAGLKKALGEGKPFQEAIGLADDMAHKTQAAYGRMYKSPLLRHTAIGSTVGQFQQYTNNLMNYVVYDLLSKRSGASNARIVGKVATFLGMAQATNMVYEELGFDAPFTVSTFIPLWNVFVRNAFEDEEARELGGGGKFGTPAAVETMRDVAYKPFKGIARTIAGDEKGADKAFKESLKAFAKIALPFGGSQVAKTVEGAFTVKDGVVQDARGKKLFEVKGTDEQLRTLLFGKYGSRAAKKYIDELREKGSLFHKKEEKPATLPTVQ